MLIFSSTTEAYVNVIASVLNKPDHITSPRQRPIREKLNMSFSVLAPTSDPITTLDASRNDDIRRYTMMEMDLYNQLTNQASDFVKASRFWSKIANPDLTVNSAYGWLIWGRKSVGNIHYEYPLTCKDWDEKIGEGDCPLDPQEMMRTPWDWAKQSLIADKDTRQAFLRFSLPEHQWFGNKDQVCTMHGIFFIREDRLHLTVVMRSCDCVKGLVYDMPWFCSLLQRMREELLFTYSGLQMGTYTHIAHSLHIYENDVDIVKKMIGET
jgi:thymidylate synthase